jgi:hypothetical protein
VKPAWTGGLELRSPNPRAIAQARTATVVEFRPVALERLMGASSWAHRLPGNASRFPAPGLDCPRRTCTGCRSCRSGPGRRRPRDPSSATQWRHADGNAHPQHEIDRSSCQSPAVPARSAPSVCWHMLRSQGSRRRERGAWSFCRRDSCRHRKTATPPSAAPAEAACGSRPCAPPPSPMAARSGSSVAPPSGSPPAAASASRA